MIAYYAITSINWKWARFNLLGRQSISTAQFKNFRELFHNPTFWVGDGVAEEVVEKGLSEVVKVAHQFAAILNNLIYLVKLRNNPLLNLPRRYRNLKIPHKVKCYTFYSSTTTFRYNIISNTAIPIYKIILIY